MYKQYQNGIKCTCILHCTHNKKTDDIHKLWQRGAIINPAI